MIHTIVLNGEFTHKQIDILRKNKKLIHHYEENEEDEIFRIKDMELFLEGTGFVFWVNLAKIYRGSKHKSLNRISVKKALINLSSILKLDVFNIQVDSIILSSIVKLKNPIPYYLACLHNPKFNFFYIDNPKIDPFKSFFMDEFWFYDVTNMFKPVQQKGKKQYLLKIELRLKRDKIMLNFKEPFLARDLYDVRVYNQLGRIWKKRINSIKSILRIQNYTFPDVKYHNRLEEILRDAEIKIITKNEVKELISKKVFNGHITPLGKDNLFARLDSNPSHFGFKSDNLKELKDKAQKIQHAIKW